MSEVAREAILARIRAGTGARTPGGALPRPSVVGAERPHAEAEKAVAVPRLYRTAGSRPRPEVLGLFEERVSDYRATVVRTPPAGLATTVAHALEGRGVRRLVVPHDLPASWLESVPEGSVELMRDGEGGRSFSKGQLASCHGVLTGCALGIAETGTLVLDAGRAQGRRALTLLPDYHLCVVFGAQVVETVPDAVTALAPGVAAHRRPVTLVSGPSATSDIELIRVEGVHGPRNLEVILVGDAT